MSSVLAYNLGNRKDIGMFLKRARTPEDTFFRGAIVFDDFSRARRTYETLKDKYLLEDSDITLVTITPYIYALQKMLQLFNKLADNSSDEVFSVLDEKDITAIEEAESLCQV